MALLVLFLGILPAKAASIIDQYGVTNILVGSTLYNVLFFGGSCEAVLQGCDETSDFTFTTESDAEAAMLALRSILNAAGRRFPDFVPNGCSDPVVCSIITPYEIVPVPEFDDFYRGYLISSAGNLPWEGSLFTDPVSRPSTDTTFTFWYTLAPIPLPASVVLLGAGLAALVALRRRARKAA